MDIPFLHYVCYLQDFHFLWPSLKYLKKS
jgi:hypothetical protein